LSEFISNVLKLVSGSVIAQILAVLLIPIITRLYTPEDYGLFSLILAITAIIAIFSSLSYQLAIMLPKEDEDAAHIVALCFVLILFSSIITGLAFFFFASPITNILNAPALKKYLWCVPFLVFFTALFSVLTYWNSRRKRFGVYAVAQVTNSLSGKGVQIGTGIADASPFGLILGSIVGFFCALLVMMKGFHVDLKFFKSTTKRRMKELAVRYKKFPLFTSWSTTANTISTQIAPLLLVYFYSPLVVGYYAIALQVVQIPMSLIGSAVSQVFFQKASEEKNKTGSISQVVHGVHRRLVSIGIFPMLLLLIIGEDLFVIVLGMQWYTAGLYAKILVPWFLLVFIASPLSTIFCVLERQYIDLTFNVSILISRILVLCIGGLLLDPKGTLVLFSITGVIFWGWLNLYLLKISNIPYKDGFNDYLHYFLVGLVVALPLILVKLLWPQSLYLIIASSILVAIIYYAIIIHQDAILKTEVLELLGR